MIPQEILAGGVGLAQLGGKRSFAGRGLYGEHAPEFRTFAPLAPQLESSTLDCRSPLG